MKIARIPLRPYSRFHFGELKLDHDLALSDTSLFAHSDTLFSALTNAYSVYADGATSFIDYFKNGELKISSLFYYLQSDSSKVYFFPKPVFLAIQSPKTKDGKHKKRNRIQFVSTGVWKNGFEADQWFDKEKYKVIQQIFVMTTEEYGRLNLSDSFSIAKIVLNPKSPKRGPEGASIYYQADIELGGDNSVQIGWYFIYEGVGKAETDLKIATNIMAYTGIGGEIKNTGRTIEKPPEFDELPFEYSPQDHTYINVALLNPKDQEQFRKVKYYRTLLRGGRLLHGNEKTHTNVVRMIEEGALIQSADLEGRLVALGSDENGRTIYRNGIPFLIPVHYDS